MNFGLDKANWRAHKIRTFSYAKRPGSRFERHGVDHKDG
jgi:hypothetical protein